MKKKLLPLVGAMLLALTIGACTAKGSNTNPDDGGGSEVVTKYTITFYVEGERYATKKVEEGQHITGVTNPTKEGYKFVCWLEGETPVDLETYVVSKDTRFDASFELDEGDVLSVDDVKEADKDYYLVFGWWESTKKQTSYLTKPDVRVFYDNIRRYLQAKDPAATDAQLANIQFRNYSSEDVASLGELVNADADVDILIGVGGNVNTIPNPETDTTGAGILLYDNNNDDYKIQTEMGSTAKKRYVACTQYASELGAETYDWITSITGKQSLLRTLTDEEIAESLAPVAANITVKAHGLGEDETPVETLLENEDTVVGLPTYTLTDDQAFIGFATQPGGEVVLEVKPNEELKLEQILPLVAEGTSTLHLYPIIAHADLVVYVQVQGTNLTRPEAELFKARVLAANPGKDIIFKIREVANGDAFTKALYTDADLVVGGNKPLNTYGVKDSENYPLADVGANNFVNKRKMLVIDTVRDGHLALAKSVYDFAKEAAAQFEVHAAYWPNGTTWVVEGGKTLIDAGMRAQLNTYLGTTDEEGKTFEAIYNVVLNTEEVAGSGVVDLGNATRALRDGKGTDLIIGCGGNVDDPAKGNFVGCEKKKVSGQPGLGTDRYVALIHENCLTRVLFDKYFVGGQQ